MGRGDKRLFEKGESKKGEDCLKSGNKYPLRTMSNLFLAIRLIVLEMNPSACKLAQNDFCHKRFPSSWWQAFCEQWTAVLGGCFRSTAFNDNELESLEIGKLKEFLTTTA